MSSGGSDPQASTTKPCANFYRIWSIQVIHLNISTDLRRCDVHLNDFLYDDKNFHMRWTKLLYGRAKSIEIHNLVQLRFERLLYRKNILRYELLMSSSRKNILLNVNACQYFELIAVHLKCSFSIFSSWRNSVYAEGWCLGFRGKEKRVVKIHQWLHYKNISK